MKHTGSHDIDKKLQELSERLSHLILKVAEVEKDNIAARKSHNETSSNLIKADEHSAQVREEVRLLQGEINALISPSFTGSAKNQSPTANSDLPPFFSKMSTWNKVLYFMQEEEEPLSASRLLVKIAEVDHEVNENEEYRKKITINVYATLNNKVKTKEIERKKVNGEFVYSLPQGSIE